MKDREVGSCLGLAGEVVQPFGTQGALGRILGHRIGAYDRVRGNAAHPRLRPEDLQRCLDQRALIGRAGRACLCDGFCCFHAVVAEIDQCRQCVRGGLHVQQSSAGLCPERVGSAQQSADPPPLYPSETLGTLRATCAPIAIIAGALPFSSVTIRVASFGPTPGADLTAAGIACRKRPRQSAETQVCRGSRARPWRRRPEPRSGACATPVRRASGSRRAASDPRARPVQYRALRARTAWRQGTQRRLGTIYECSQRRRSRSGHDPRRCSLSCPEILPIIARQAIAAAIRAPVPAVQAWQIAMASASAASSPVTLAPWQQHRDHVLNLRLVGMADADHRFLDGVRRIFGHRQAMLCRDQ